MYVGVCLQLSLSMLTDTYSNEAMMVSFVLEGFLAFSQRKILLIKVLYVKRIHQDWKKKKWGLKLCGYLFWNKTIFDNLIILVFKPGWIVHAKYGFFLWLTQRAYVMMHTNFLQTLLKLLCSIFLIVDINTYCFYQHFLMQPLYDPYQPVSFLFSFPCPVPFASQGCWLIICPVRSQRKYHVITRSN